MLDKVAWLRDAREHRALHVSAWSAGPVNGRLSFYAPDFALTAAEPWLIGEEIAFPEFNSVSLPRLSHRAEPSSALFERLHEDILNRIGAGEFQKVVPIVCEELEYERPL